MGWYPQRCTPRPDDRRQRHLRRRVPGQHRGRLRPGFRHGDDRWHVRRPRRVRLVDLEVQPVGGSSVGEELRCQQPRQGRGHGRYRWQRVRHRLPDRNGRRLGHRIWHHRPRLCRLRPVHHQAQLVRGDPVGVCRRRNRHGGDAVRRFHCRGRFRQRVHRRPLPNCIGGNGRPGVRFWDHQLHLDEIGGIQGRGVPLEAQLGGRPPVGGGLPVLWQRVRLRADNPRVRRVHVGVLR